MPTELMKVLLAHGGWAIGLCIALWAWWAERKENRLMGQLLAASVKEQALAQQASNSAIEKLCDKIDSFLDTYTVRRPR